MRDDGLKIVFFSNKTEISKFTKGETADLKVVNNVIISGKTNSDESLTGQTIQLRPAIQPSFQN